MSTVIYKYPLRITDFQSISVPEGAQILDVQVQNGQIQLWALVDDINLFRSRTIRIIGTGNTIYPQPGTYIATVQLNGFVWHIFDASEL